VFDGHFAQTATPFGRDALRQSLLTLFAALVTASLLPAAASAQDNAIVFNWSDRWNSIFHRIEDLDGNGDFLGPDEVDFHIDPAAPASAQPRSLRVVSENGVLVSYFLLPSEDTIARGIDLDGDGLLSDGEITDYRDSGTLDGSSTMTGLDVTEDGAVWWSSGIIGSQPVNGLMRLADLNGDDDAADPGEQVVMANGNSSHPFEHDNGSATFAPWTLQGLAADGDGVIAYSSSDGCVLRFEDLDGNGDVTGPGESIMLLNASGKRLDLPQNPDFANGTLKSLQTNASYPAPLGYLATTEVDDERVYYFGTNVSPFATAGTNVNGKGVNFLLFRGIDTNGDGDVNDAGEVQLYFDGSHTDGNPDLLLMRGMDVTEDDVVYAVGLEPYPAWSPGPNGNTRIHRFERLNSDLDAMDPGEQQLSIFDVQSIGLGPLFPIPPNFGNMMCDPSDFSVRAVSRWTDVGGGILGSHGVPTLTGEGSLVAGSPTSVYLVNTPPNAPMYLWMSLSSTPTPLFGGVLYTVPIDLQVLLNANAAGELSLLTAWPAGIPSGFTTWIQFLIQDNTLTPNMSFSNALRLTTP